MENANLKELIALDLDGSDNLTEDMLFKFISKYGPQMQGNFFNFLKCISEFDMLKYILLVRYS